MIRRSSTRTGSAPGERSPAAATGDPARKRILRRPSCLAETFASPARSGGWRKLTRSPRFGVDASCIRRPPSRSLPREARYSWLGRKFFRQRKAAPTQPILQHRYGRRCVALLAVFDRCQRLDVDASARILDILAIKSGELGAIGLVVGLCMSRDRRREERRHKEQENAFHEMPDKKGRRPTSGACL
jgi:hypothetical protein